MLNIDFDKIDLSVAPPEEEPERQYYFIAKCRKWLEQKKEELGRPLYYSIQTFGCQMNARDSEKISGILEQIGYEPSGEETKADLVLYNTCTVRENANLKVYGKLGYLKSLKKKNPHLRIALCGCMMQEESVVEKIKKSYSFVDLIFGTHNIFRFAELLDRCHGQKKMVIDIWKDTSQIVEELPNERKYSFKAGVNIMFGCNNFCSYCIVPYVRGRERSRRMEDILSEIRNLVEDGVVEVMLLGQNVNSYGKNLQPQVSFAELLREVEKIEGLKRIRFMTPHPKDLSDELIEVMKESTKICRHIHLPVQSGSTEILRKMNRHYTKEQYLALVEKIKRELPDVAITTDIIVGFPGETEEDFLETMDLVEKCGYDSAFTFQYSKRTGTPAAAMENQVPQEVVTERFDRLLALVQKESGRLAQEAVGTVQEVLAEEVNAQDETMLTGRLSNNRIVHFKGGRRLIGQLLSVKLTECHGFYYTGSIEES